MHTGAMSAEVDDRSRVLSVRLPAQTYRLAKAYTSLSGSTMNALMVQAVTDYLRRHASEEQIAALVERHRASLQRRGDEG